MPDISAVLIVKNEAVRIDGCLEALSFCDEVVVVDSGSSDATAAKAAEKGARVFHRAFDDFSSQKNFAMAQARGDWFFLVDADERPSEELVRELRASAVRGRHDAYAVPRRTRLFGRWMRYGASLGDAPVRFVRRGRGRYVGRVHESLRVDGSVGSFRGELLHDSTSSIGEYMSKLKTYVRLEADELAAAGACARVRDIAWRPVARFFQMGVVRLGLLDGVEGFIAAALSAYYEFLRWALLWEIGRKKAIM